MHHILGKLYPELIIFGILALSYLNYYLKSQHISGKIAIKKQEPIKTPAMNTQ